MIGRIFRKFIQHWIPRGSEIKNKKYWIVCKTDTTPLDQDRAKEKKNEH